MAKSISSSVTERVIKWFGGSLEWVLQFWFPNPFHGSNHIGACFPGSLPPEWLLVLLAPPSPWMHWDCAWQPPPTLHIAAPLH
eukprot:1874326-Amphidinium_carterae.1